MAGRGSNNKPSKPGMQTVPYSIPNWVKGDIKLLEFQKNVKCVTLANKAEEESG